MAQVGWLLQLDKCIGCESCTVACKAENNTVINTNWRWVVFQEGGTYPNVFRKFTTSACNHCEEPACLKACPLSDSKDFSNPNNAITKRKEDGIVLINQDTCIGCKYCLWACPFGAPQFNEETNKVEKCTYCVHRVDAGIPFENAPACATTCLGRVINAGEAAQLGAKLDKARETLPDQFADPALTKASIKFEGEVKR